MWILIITAHIHKSYSRKALNDSITKNELITLSRKETGFKDFAIEIVAINIIIS